MATALVALGSNLGDRQAMLDRALEMLRAQPEIRLVAVSQPHATLPIGGPSGQTEFLNAAARIETSLGPAALLAILQGIETSLGRNRDGQRWASRPIDLDLLLYGSEVIDRPGLVLPHPRMAFRRFVIEPAAEIAPDMPHPTIGWTLAELRDHLRSAVSYVAIAGAPGSGKSQLAADVAATLGIRLLAEPAKQLAASAAAVASGPAWQREIELLDTRTAQLAGAFAADRETVGHAELPGRAAISDYWFDQALCHADLILPPERAEEFRSRWESAAAKVVRPKLLVLLDAPADWLLHRAASSTARTDSPSQAVAEQLRRNIVARASEHGRGPLLRLDARDAENARTELAAAIQAMT